MTEKQEQLQAAAAKVGVGTYHRHVFLCTGPTCCTPETGLAAWEALKQKIKECGLGSGPNACYRTKVGCLRICCHGPTMLVYPEGTWYNGMTAERIPQFVQQHLIDGKPVEEWIFAGNPLPCPACQNQIAVQIELSPPSVEGDAEGGQDAAKSNWHP